jgi:hypothetical protein
MAEHNGIPAGEESVDGGVQGRGMTVRALPPVEVGGEHVRVRVVRLWVERVCRLPGGHRRAFWGSSLAGW